MADLKRMIIDKSCGPTITQIWKAYITVVIQWDHCIQWINLFGSVRPVPVFIRAEKVLTLQLQSVAASRTLKNTPFHWSTHSQCRNSYLEWGIRFPAPATIDMIFLCDIITPLGTPVEPLVYMMTARSSGVGITREKSVQKWYKIWALWKRRLHSF